MDPRNALFGGRGTGQGLPRRPGGDGPAPPRQPGFNNAPPPAYGQPNAGYPGSRGPPQQGFGQPQQSYGQPQQGYGQPPQASRGEYSEPAPAKSYGGGGGGGGGGQGPREVSLRLAKVEDKTLQQQYIFMDICAVSPYDFPPNPDGSDIYLRIYGRMISGDYVVTARPTPGFPSGHISLSDPQRTWMRVGFMDELMADVYDPFASKTGRESYLAFMDIDVKFASAKKVSDMAFDHEMLATLARKNFENHIFSPGQKLLLDVQNVPLALTVLTVQLTGLGGGQGGAAQLTNLGAVRSDAAARGIMVPQTSITFVKNAGSSIRLTGVARRAASKEIFAPSFNFEAMGIGGLDNQFSTVFRRAFASRLIPPETFEKLGISHVKGVLLYGPPGTGKTLMAREIGKMLNAREPKIINGPEVLNKYVGQSEENIRALFADAEKEYEEKGDESQLHLIIFDELDAVCKQRGSGTSGGTGVGDSVVNQLLSKLDGVKPLNNVLLVGMTNRKDMIDDALLRPGRLEVQVEIGLPNEQGRVQILKIHTAHMQKSNVLADDVDIEELARLTPNFSGAELAGLVKSATSFAFDDSVKPSSVRNKTGQTAPAASPGETKVKMIDFENALSEVTAAYGASKSDLKSAMANGIIHYSSHIGETIKEILFAASNIKTADGLRAVTTLLYGPPGSGKKALAAHAALESKIPFIRIVTAEHLVGFASEASKKEFVHRVFTDAYKSPLSMLILGNIEELIEWNPVGPRFNNSMVTALKTLLRMVPPKDNRLLIVATTSSLSVLNMLEMTDIFSRQLPVPAVANMSELAAALQELDVFQGPSLNSVINTVQQRNNGSDEVNVGIKQVLELARAAKEDDDPESWYAHQLTRVMYSFNAGRN